jgi:hypothetical protein
MLTVFSLTEKYHQEVTEKGRQVCSGRRALAVRRVRVPCTYHVGRFCRERSE